MGIAKCIISMALLSGLISNLIYANAEHSAENNHLSTNMTRTTAIEHKTTEDGRTFGQIKKFQFALLPVMYKLGVMSTIVMVILFLSVKGVFIGTLLLIMNIAFFAVKIASLKSSQPYQWTSNAAPPVHLHIHNSEQSIAPPHYEPYGTYLPSPSWKT